MFCTFISNFVCSSPLSFFSMSLAKGLSIFKKSLKKQNKTKNPDLSFTDVFGLYFTSGLIFIISYFLLTLSFVCSFFISLDGNLGHLFGIFLVYWGRPVIFPLRTLFVAFHKFWIVLFLFSFIIKIFFWFLLWFLCWLSPFLVASLFSFHMSVCFKKFIFL